MEVLSPQVDLSSNCERKTNKQKNPTNPGFDFILNAILRR